MKKVFQAFFVSFGAIVAIVFLVALFLPSEFRISRSLEMNAPIEKIFPYVADFSKWKEWSPWYELQPDAQYVFVGKMGNVGSKMSWSGRRVGQGSMILTHVDSPHRVEMDLLFEKPQHMESHTALTFESRENKTYVTWDHSGPLTYPLGRWFGLMMESMMGKDFEKGLGNIKTFIEKPSS